MCSELILTTWVTQAVAAAGRLVGSPGEVDCLIHFDLLKRLLFFEKKTNLHLKMQFKNCIEGI